MLPKFSSVKRKKVISLPKIKWFKKFTENPCVDSTGPTNPKLTTHTAIILFKNL